VPRPTGAAAAELDRRIAEVGKRNRRAGHDTTVRIRHQKPQKRITPKERERQLAERAAGMGYQGWKPREKTCRREACAKTFLPTAPAQAYCTPECRDLAEREQRASASEQRSARRERRERPSDEEAATRICRLDGCEVEFTPTSNRQAYCTPEHSDEARAKQKRRSYERSKGPVVGQDTAEAIAEIERLEKRLAGKLKVLPELQREYLVLLWTRVNRDPACPAHVYDRLERVLDLPAAEGSTIPAPDAAS
jgi:hypothetical protein